MQEQNETRNLSGIATDWLNNGLQEVDRLLEEVLGEARKKDTSIPGEAEHITGLRDIIQDTVSVFNDPIIARLINDSIQQRFPVEVQLTDTEAEAVSGEL